MPQIQNGGLKCAWILTQDNGYQVWFSGKTELVVNFVSIKCRDLIGFAKKFIAYPQPDYFRVLFEKSIKLGPTFLKLKFHWNMIYKKLSYTVISKTIALTAIILRWDAYTFLGLWNCQNV